MVSVKSKIESASLSIKSLFAYGSIVSSVLIERMDLDALLAEPTTVSPGMKDPDTILSSNTLVIVFQELTRAVVPLVLPVTTSLYSKVPDVVNPTGDSIVIVGTLE